MKIIVARYNEDVSWTKQFPNVLIYNKGEKLNEEEGYNQVMMGNNVGREGHTFYKYIYDNYDNLDDYTVFLQGNPFDHSPNLVSKLNKLINNERMIGHFKFLSENIFPCGLNISPHHPGLPLKQVYKRLFNKRVSMLKFKFGAGQQFIVSKKKILKRRRKFYLKIVKMLQNEINPIEGYVIERFPTLIFLNPFAKNK